MADSTDNPSSSSQRRSRGPTMMAQIDKVHQSGQKIKVVFDQRTHDCIGVGKNAATFTSYVASLARMKCSILIKEWKDVPRDIKEAIWVDVKAHFTIPDCDDANKDPLKDEWIKYAGQRWRAFKTQLTKDYIRKPVKGRPPAYVKYNYIKEEVWNEFVKSRDTPEFKEKSQKGMKNVAKNVYPHVLSRGGYRLLEERMKNERRPSKADSTIDDDGSPSPPSRHDIWKRARQKKGGEYTSQSTQAVAEKIDTLVQEAEKGAFVPDGRNDILTTAIGTSEKGGRVRGVGKHHKQSTYFGRFSSRRLQEFDVREQLSQFSSELEAKLRAEFEQKMIEERKVMQQSLMETLKSMGFSQNTEDNKCIEKLAIVDGSGKGSCSVSKAGTKEVEVDDAQRLLLKVLKMDSDNHMEIALTHCFSCTNFFMSAKCTKEFLLGNFWLDLSVLQVWCTYIHSLCVDNSTSNVYGIMDPAVCTYTDKVQKTIANVKKYIQDKLRDEVRVCYLLPFLHGGHWQLIIICPRDNTVVVMCSLHKGLNETMTKIVTNALGVHQMAIDGNRKKPTWLLPKTRLQTNSNDCGYYVMKSMLDIVSANVTDNWMQVFDDPTALTNDDLNDLKVRWASCFFELYKD